MLPKPLRPEYSTNIPSTGKKIKYQPFTVKEEKILVLASESGDNDEIANALFNILRNCITSPADINLAGLALFDIEYLFLKARSKSAGEKIELKITDPNDETYSVQHSINIDKIGITRTEGHDKVIKLDDSTIVNMRYPDLSFFVEGININNIKNSIETIVRCVESLIINDEVYETANMSDGELEEWIESLTTEQYNKVLQFFLTMPRLSHTINLKNEKTGNPFTIELQGLADFF